MHGSGVMTAQPVVAPWVVARPQEGGSALIMSPDERDHTFLRAALPANWRILGARNFSEGVSLLRAQPVALVVAECDLGECSWAELLDEIRAVDWSPAPRLIGISRRADERLWADMLSRGAYDLLLKPLHHSEVSWVIRQGFLDWKGEHERTAAVRLSTGAGSA